MSAFGSELPLSVIFIGLSYSSSIFFLFQDLLKVSGRGWNPPAVPDGYFEEAKPIEDLRVVFRREDEV